MKKENAINIIAECAKLYKENLENKNLLFVFGADKTPEFFEASFLPRNFLHLTGVKIFEERVGGSVDFYERCLRRKLSPSDFSFADNGTTVMKLSILPQLMKIQTCAKMVGTYDFTKSMLFTEKVAGNIYACMGFVKENNYYIPNTALREDIRNISERPQKRILAIFKKDIPQKFYTLTPCYSAKKVNILCIVNSENLKQKFDFTSYS